MSQVFKVRHIKAALLIKPDSSKKRVTIGAKVAYFHTSHHRTKYTHIIRQQSPNPRNPGDEFDQDGHALRNTRRVIWGAVFINGANFVAKSTAWLYTGSHSMFAEAVHSLADTANQLILAVGIRKSIQEPTADHPYGYHPMRYIAPLISGVGIFCVGCGLSMYHGIEALMNDKPELFISPSWAYGILAFSFISESTSLLIAVHAIREGASKSKLKMSDYIATNSDPGVIVVLLEDLAAVLGIGIAATCMALSAYHNTHIYDAVGSLMIGSLLGGVATFIIKKNTVALVGKSIQRDTLNSINRIIEKDVMIRKIHDVKATDLGNGVIRYKAEVDVNGEELTKRYIVKEARDRYIRRSFRDRALEKDLGGVEVNFTEKEAREKYLNDLLEEIREVKDNSDAEAFVMKHGEGVVDLLGHEIDRIEKEIRKKYPKVKHVDLEVL